MGSWPGGFRGRDQVQDAMLSREAGGPVARGDEEVGWSVAHGEMVSFLFILNVTFW